MATLSNDEKKDHIVVNKVLEVTLDKSEATASQASAYPGGSGSTGVMYLPEAAQEGSNFKLDKCDQYLQERLTAERTLTNQLNYLGAAFTRSCSQPSFFHEKAKKIQEQILNFTTLALTFPDMFGGMEMDLGTIGKEFSSAVLGKKISIGLMQQVAGRLLEDNKEAYNAIWSQLVNATVGALAGRDQGDQKPNEFGLFASLVGANNPAAMKNHPLIDVITGLAAFMPPPPEPNFFIKTAACSRKYQSESIFGVLLSPSVIDNHVDSQKSASATVNSAFKLLKDGKMAMNAMNATVKSLREGISMNFNTNLGIFNVFLRHSEASRNKTLAWLGKVVAGTAIRTKSQYQIAHSAQELAGMIGNGIHTRQGQQPPPPLETFNLLMQTQQGINPRLHGYATPGFAINTFWILLELVKPVKMSSQLDILASIREDCKPLLESYCDLDRVVDKDNLEEVKKLPEIVEAMKAPMKFPSQIFWVSLSAMHQLFLPVLSDAHKIMYASSQLVHEGHRQVSSAVFAEYQCCDVILRHPEFMSLLGNFLSLVMYQILAAVYPDLAKEHNAETNPNPFKKMIVPPASVTNEFKTIPSSIIEDIIDILKMYKDFQRDGVKSCELFTRFIDQEILLFFMTFVLGAGDHIRNPNTRGDAAKILYDLSGIPSYHSLITNSPTCSNNIIPACLLVFTAVERTHQSYYDIRMQIKFTLRIPIMKLLAKVLNLPHHKQALKDFASARSENFMKFANQIMNDVTYLVDEGMDTLIAIRKRSKLRPGEEDTEDTEGAATAGLGVQRDIDEAEDMNEQGQDIYRQSRETEEKAKQRCKQYMEMGHLTAETLWKIAVETPSVLVSDTIILTQMIQSCLDPLLDRLVGPKCLELKGNSRDFEQFNFDPNKLLLYCIEMFVCIARETQQKAAKIVSEDARNFKGNTFTKAVRIAKRTKIISDGDMLADFEKFVEQIHKASAQAEEAAEVDVPEEYLDPIMADVMMDPVELPSGHVMDRKNIERIILTDDADPFSRQPLKKDDLKPREDLRSAIEEFCKKNNMPYNQND